MLEILLIVDFSDYGVQETWLDVLTCFWPILLLVPLFIVSLWSKTWPTGITIVLMGVPILVSALFFILDIKDGYRLVRTLDLFVLLVLTSDLITIAFINPFRVKRETERVASLAREHKVSLRIENQGRFDRRVRITDDVLSPLNNSNGLFQQEEMIPAGKFVELNYQFKPLVRGAFQMETVWIFFFSPGRLWKKELKIHVETNINVYPDLRQITQYELLARSQRLHQLGLRRIRRVGLDNDFERLRDYTPDDQYKFIDWKATARHHKLIVKDFQMNRSQRIIFMIDSGRMMMNQINGLSFLDYAFNSMLMLAYIALKQGDEVGFLCFSEEVRQYIAPKPGMNHMNHLIHGSFNLFPEPLESRYDQAFAYLETHCRKRSLLVLITNIIDERNSTQISGHLRNLTGQHLPLGVFLRDHTLFDPLKPLTTKENVSSELQDTRLDLSNMKTPLALEQSEEERLQKQLNSMPISTLCRTGAAAEILNWRYKVLKELSAHGTMTLDLFPEDITAPLINKYLEIKVRHLL